MDGAANRRSIFKTAKRLAQIRFKTLGALFPAFGTTRTDPDLVVVPPPAVASLNELRLGIE